MEEEIWRDIKGYEGSYQISNYGKVKSLERKVFIPQSYGLQHRQLREKLLSILNSSIGYHKVILTKNATQKQFCIHRLIAEAFIPNPDNLPIINHKNGIKTDNRIENLEWCTQQHNIIHSWEMGFSKPYWQDKGGIGYFGNKSVCQYDKNGNLLATFYSFKQASEITKVSRSGISLCVSGKLHHAGGYIWKRNAA